MNATDIINGDFTQDYLDRIANKFPWIVGTSLYGEENYNWYSDMPIGWAKAFGEQFLYDLNEAINTLRAKAKNEFHIFQIKEKFGTLRVYVSFTNIAINEVIEKYSNLSKTICIDCGEQATHMTTGWIVPLCDKCDTKINR